MTAIDFSNLFEGLFKNWKNPMDNFGPQEKWIAVKIMSYMNNF